MPVRQARPSGMGALIRPDARAVFGAEVLPCAVVLVNHTGRRAVLLGNTAIRIVCANTLSVAEREAETGARQA